ncbi:hypothetical protein H6F96_04815 [Microcoleus sp. FACHB-53]|nr:hypothetical protein [Microcoleus sp. FACHB-53]
MRTWQIGCYIGSKGMGKAPTSVVTRRWGAGRNHQDITMHEPEVEKWVMGHG